MDQLAMNYICYLSHTDPLTNIRGSCLFGWWVQHDKIMSCQVDELMTGNTWHEYMINWIIWYFLHCYFLHAYRSSVELDIQPH